MTHEHMDHVQGLLAASKLFNLNLTARLAWMTASAAKDYYDTHPAAGKAFRQTLAAFEQIESFMAAAPEAAHPALMAVLLNNSPSRTADCVDYLRTLAGPRTRSISSADLISRATIPSRKRGWSSGRRKRIRRSITASFSPWRWVWRRARMLG